MNHIVKDPGKLIEVLSQFYPDSSKRTLQIWIDNGRVTVDDQIVKKPHHNVSPNQSLKVNPKQNLISVKTIFPVLFSDTHLIVIDKPEGLLSVPKDCSSERNALEHLRFAFRDDMIYAVHRLDQNTSGVLVFAKGKPAAVKLSKMFKERSLTREYYAVTEGVFEKDEGQLKCYVKQLANLSMIKTNDPSEGKEAITDFKVLKRTDRTTHLLLTLRTGKKHQIRLHLKEENHPVLGDELYGSKIDPIKRLCLHATTLNFIHPFTGKQMNFTSPVPNSFKNL